MAHHFKKLQTYAQAVFDDKKLLDVSIETKDGCIRAHKIVLASYSPYFHSMIDSSGVMADTIYFKDISLTVMLDVVVYMYSGNTEHFKGYSSNEAINVANKLQIQDLVTYLQKNISSTAVAETLNDLNCESTLTDSSQLSHLDVDDKQRCPVCNTECNDLELLQGHRTLHASGSVTCSICQAKAMTSVDELTNHADSCMGLPGNEDQKSKKPKSANE